MRQHVGADHDAALHFLAKTFGARLFVHLGQVAVVGGAVAVTHTVKAAEVGTGLGRGDHVVGRDRQAGFRQADFNNVGAELLELCHGFVNHAGDVGIQPFGEKLFRQADLQPGNRTGQITGVVFRRALDAGRIVLVKPGHDVEQQGAIFCGLRHRPALVERTGIGHHAVAADHAIGRLDAGNAAEGGRLADRTAGVSTGCGRHQARGHGGGRAPRAATRHSGQIPRVFHRAVERVFVRRAHGEFVHVGLADRHQTGSLAAGHHGGVVRADEVVEHLRAARGFHAFGDEEVLVRQRNAGQR